VNSEISSILRLNGWAGRVVLLVYGVGTAIVAVLNLSGLIVPTLGVVALVLFGLGLALLAFGGGEPLDLRWTIGIVVVVTATTAISSWNILDPQNPGYATWPLGAMTFLLFVLALRGRKALAWIGFATVAVVSVVLAIVFGQEVISVVNDVLRQSATLIIGTLFAIVLRRGTQTIASLQSREVSRVAVEAAAATASRERDAQNARLEQDSRPALERIIAPEPFSPQDIQGFKALSATLRGGIQPAGSSGMRIADAVRQARVRGLTVNLVDDRGTELPAAVVARLEEELLPLLSGMSYGSVTVRLSPDYADEIATFVVEEGGLYRRIILTMSEKIDA
jgi:hypothetical protein